MNQVSGVFATNLVIVIDLNSINAWFHIEMRTDEDQLAPVHGTMTRSFVIV